MIKKLGFSDVNKLPDDIFKTTHEESTKKTLDKLRELQKRNAEYVSRKNVYRFRPISKSVDNVSLMLNSPEKYSVRTLTDTQAEDELLRMFKILIQTAAANKTQEEVEQEKERFMTEYSTQISKYKLYNKLNGIFNLYRTGKLRDTNSDSSYLVKGTSDKFLESLKERYKTESTARAYRDQEKYNASTVDLGSIINRDARHYSQGNTKKLTADIASLDHALAQKNEEIGKLELAIRNIQEEIESESSKFQDEETKIKLQVLREQLARQEHKLNITQKDIDEIRSLQRFTSTNFEERRKEQSDEASRIQSRMELLDKQVHDLERHIAELKGKLKVDKDTHKELTAELERYTKYLATYRSFVSEKSDQIDELRGMIQRNISKDSKRALRVQIDELTSEMEEQSKLATKTNTTVQKIQRDIRKLDRSIPELEKEIEQKESNVLNEKMIEYHEIAARYAELTGLEPRAIGADETGGAGAGAGAGYGLHEGDDVEVGAGGGFDLGAFARWAFTPGKRRAF